MKRQPNCVPKKFFIVISQSAILLVVIIVSLRSSQYNCTDADVFNAKDHFRVERKVATGHLIPNVSVTETTALIITSSWIPTHPSTEMIDTVINSTRRLIGLSPAAPTIVTVDDFHIDFFTKTNNSSEINAKRHDLEGYTMNLFKKYSSAQNFHILPGMDHLHVGGSVIKAIELIEHLYPTVKYLYYIQHDYEFSRWIDHIALVEVLEENPTTVNLIRFLGRKEKNPICGNTTEISHAARNFDEHGKIFSNVNDIGDKGALTLVPVEKYSDNNHLVRLTWYKETIQSLTFVRRFPEDPLQRRAREVCQKNESMGLYLYGYDPTLRHLDGRHAMRESNQTL